MSTWEQIAIRLVLNIILGADSPEETLDLGTDVYIPRVGDIAGQVGLQEEKEGATQGGLALDLGRRLDDVILGTV